MTYELVVASVSEINNATMSSGLSMKIEPRSICASIGVIVQTSGTELYVKNSICVG